MSSINQEQAAIASRQAIAAILSGSAPPSADYGPYRPLITQLSKKLASDGAEAARALYDVLLLNNKQLAALMATSEQGAESADPLSSYYPSLPPEAHIDPTLGAYACQWLDDYIAWSRYWSPRAYDGFHQACGLWILSTIAARRVYIPYGTGEYTGLYVGLAARSGRHAKSKTSDLATKTLRRAGLGWLLLPDESTPQKMRQLMAAGDLVTESYSGLSEADKELIKRRVALAGQRGWLYDEFGEKLEGMNRDNGPMADFRSLLRRLYDGKDVLSNATMSRGTEEVQQPYLAMLAMMTPSDIKETTKPGAPLWKNGFWGRWALVTPGDAAPSRAALPTMEDCDVPEKLTTPLKRWHAALGLPEVEITEETGKDEKPTGRYTIHRGELPRQRCTIDADVLQAYARYCEALEQISDIHPDLDSNYARIAPMALKVAALFASLENAGHIQMRHYARAQAIVEGWRASLHWLMEQVTTDQAPSHARKGENKIIETIQKLGKMGKKATLRNIYTWGNMSAAEAKLQVTALVDIGLLEKGKDGPRAEVYRVAIQEAATG